MQNVAALPMETQRQRFLENLNEWQQLEEQRDDITLIGLKVK
jgi:serine phosphatase RsbU (regulator of sigma subunit)